MFLFSEVSGKLHLPVYCDGCEGEGGHVDGDGLGEADLE